MTPRPWYHPLRWHPLVLAIVSLLFTLLLALLMFVFMYRQLGSVMAVHAWISESEFGLFLWRVLFVCGLCLAWLNLLRPRMLARVAQDRDGGEYRRRVLELLERYTLYFLAFLEILNQYRWWVL